MSTYDPYERWKVSWKSVRTFLINPRKTDRHTDRQTRQLYLFIYLFNTNIVQEYTQKNKKEKRTTIKSIEWFHCSFLSRRLPSIFLQQTYRKYRRFDDKPVDRQTFRRHETSDPCRRNVCRSMVCRRKVCRRNVRTPRIAWRSLNSVLEHGDFWTQEKYFTWLSCGWTADSLQSPLLILKEFWKSINVCQSCSEIKKVRFFDGPASLTFTKLRTAC